MTSYKIGLLCGALVLGQKMTTTAAAAAAAATTGNHNISSSGVYLGLTDVFHYPKQYIRTLKSGPGGHILAMLSQSSISQEWKISLWSFEYGMYCLGEYSLGCYQTREICLTSLLWHPSGQYLYLLIGGIVALITLKILNQEKKMISILELITLLSDSSDGYHCSVEFRIFKKYNECDVTSLTLVNDGQTCMMGTFQNNQIILSSWKFDLIRYISLSMALVCVGTEMTQLNFLPGIENRSQLDSTRHGEESGPFVSLIFPPIMWGDLLVGYTSQNTLLFVRTVSEPFEFTPFIEVENVSGILQLATYQNQWNSDTIIVCLSSRDVLVGNILSVDIDVVIMKFIYGNSCGTLEVLSRTPYMSNLSKEMLKHLCNDSTLCFLQNSPSCNADIVVSFGNRIICYRLDLSALSFNSKRAQSNYLSIIFVINTSEAGIESISSTKYTSSLHTCIVSDRLITVNTLEDFRREIEGDNLEEGSVIHNTSFVLDLQGSLCFPTVSSGVLYHVMERQLYVFKSQSQFTSITNPIEHQPPENLVPIDVSSRSRLRYHDHFSYSSSLPLFSSEGDPHYQITRIPKTLHHDLIVNSCGIDNGKKITVYRSLNSCHSIGGGLLVSRESIGGIYLACAIDTALYSDVSENVNSPLVWLHSMYTSKWKLIMPHRYPASSNCILFLPWKMFQRKEVSRHLSTPEVLQDEYPRTKKQYFNSRCALVSVKRISWFGNHTLVLCTQREQNNKQPNDLERKSKTSIPTPILERHFCIELMTRKTVDPIVIRHSTHKIPELVTETRRISFPHLQSIIPLPSGFVPFHLDIVPTRSHVDRNFLSYSAHDSQVDSSHSNGESDVSFHPPNHDEEVFQMRRMINRSHSGGHDSFTKGGNKSIKILDSSAVNSDNSHSIKIEFEDSCILLLGAHTRFIALHITATTHILEDEMSSINNHGSNSNTRRKYTNTTNFQEFVSFYPSSYRVKLLWDIEIQSIPLYSPSLAPMHLTLPLKQAFFSTVPHLNVKVDRCRSHSLGESTHSSISNEIEGCDSRSLLTSLILLDSVGKVSHLCFSNVNSTDYTYECVGTIINLGLCSSITRLQHYLFPVTESSPFALRDVYYLHCQSDASDVLWLPHAKMPNHHLGGAILSVVKRPHASFLFSLPSDNLCSYLSYTSCLKLVGFRHRQGALQMSPSVLSLHHTSIPLIMFLSVINTHPHPRGSNLFISEFLIPFYTYSSPSTHWMKYMLSHLSLHPFPLQRLTEGLEIVLKSIINREGFTRYHPEFALLTSILFSCDDVLFIEIMSRLCRKLEPHVSASLFPLPNYRMSPDTKSLRKSGESSQRVNSYRGVSIQDSPWDQLALFELCLSRCALTHASRFLTSACDQLGGSQSLESVAASLILSHELLLECFRHLQLECALECLEFCMRLDVMAAELLHNQSYHSAPQNTVRYLVQSVSSQLVNGISYLNPLIGSDFHNLVEDTLQPQNSRSYSGINMYHYPLYKDPISNLRLHETAKFQVSKGSDENGNVDNIRAYAVSKGRYVYTAFAAWNQMLLNCQTRGLNLNTSSDLTVSIQETLLNSYSSLAVKHVISSLLQNSQIISCAAVASIVNYHLSTSSSNTTTWFSRSLFASSQPLRIPKLLTSVLKAFNLIHSEIHPAKPAQSPHNHEILRILNSFLPEFDIRKKCEMEMYVSYSEHQADGGCLITLPSYHNNHLISHVTNTQHSDHIRYTSVSCHGRASSQFTIPILGEGKTFTVSQLLRGLAMTSLMMHSYDLLLLIAIIHCRLDIVRHILLYLQSLPSTNSSVSVSNRNHPEENFHFQTILLFCISQSNEMVSTTVHLPQFMNSVLPISAPAMSTNSTGESVEEINGHGIKFLKWLGGTKTRSIHEISDGIEKFLLLLHEHDPS